MDENTEIVFLQLLFLTHLSVPAANYNTQVTLQCKLSHTHTDTKPTPLVLHVAGDWVTTIIYRVAGVTYTKYLCFALNDSLSILPLCLSHTEQLKWSQPTLNCATPSPALAAHGCAVIGSQIYTFGGLTSSGACSILYCFDTGWNYSFVPRLRVIKQGRA